MASAKDVIDRVRDPCGAEQWSGNLVGHSIHGFNLQKGNGNVRAGIDETDNPAILLACARGQTRIPTIWNTQSSSEGQVRTVGASLIPALDGGGDGVHDDGEVEHPRLLESVRPLLAKRDALVLVQLVQLFEEEGRLGNKSTFAQERGLFRQAMLGTPSINIGEKLLFRDADERVFDSASVSKGGVRVRGPRCQSNLLSGLIVGEIGDAGATLLLGVEDGGAARVAYPRSWARTESVGLM